jgi:hypothetical protein
MQPTTFGENSRTRVRVGCHTRKVAGRIRSFSEAETETLRALARKLKVDRDWNGTKLGEAMGVKQQNANRFVADHSTSGIDRTTANNLAVACGFRDVEHALLEAGTLAILKQPPGGGSEWRTRDSARELALRLGYPIVAIDAVIHRYTRHLYTGKPVRFWMDHFVLEAMHHRDEEEQGDDEVDAAAGPKRSGTEG